MLHRKWCSLKGSGRIEKYHPELIGLKPNLKNHWSYNSYNAESTARINLPFQVQTYISQQFKLAWEDISAKGVYVEPREQEEQHGVSKDYDSFEIC